MPFVEDRSILGVVSLPPDREIRYGDDPLHIADVWDSRPGAGGSLVLLIHGGFWRPAYDRKHLGPLANAIADAGFTVASIEYRRIPGSPDHMTSDVALACTHVPRALDPKDARAIVIGHSAGGHLALWSATAVTTSNLKVIALAPVASLTMGESLHLGDGAVDAFLGVPAATRPDLDPLERKSPSVPVSIVHGLSDAIVPVTLSEQFARKHPATHVVKIEDAGHFAVIDPRTSSWPVLLAEIKRLAT